MYSIKMRASQNSRHISGSEKIVTAQQLPDILHTVTKRALYHSLGQPDLINLKIQPVDKAEIICLPALQVTEHFSQTITENMQFIREKLAELIPGCCDDIIQLLNNMPQMRGAILYDVHTRQRCEKDLQRGIRVTYMDAEIDSGMLKNKNHFFEALILATKVAHAPGMLAELCISDDPDYVTGYFASLKHGYIRLSPVKEPGSSHGGRIFIFDSSEADAETVINYLEKTKVLVTDIKTDFHQRENIQDCIRTELLQLKKADLYRQLKIIETQQQKNITIANQPLLMFSSNSYLNLAAHPAVKQAAAEACLAWGAGSGGSRLTTGTNSLHVKLEAMLAELKHTESALLFNTGYTANVGVLSALADEDTVIFSDEYNHASIIDGCRLSKGRIIVYKHNDMQDLEKKINSIAFTKGILVSDSVFSMDGDILNLPKFVELGRKYQLLTIIDEAHATGVIGKTGKGAAEYYSYQAQPDIIIGTLSKALGSEGGFVCASAEIIEYLKNKARSFIFSTAQNPASLAAAIKSIELLNTQPDLVQKLQHNIRYFCQCLQKNKLAVQSDTAIIPVIIGSETAALSAAQTLYDKGFLIPAIRYPTVAKNTARLRITLMSSHTETELALLAREISQAVHKSTL